MDRFTITKPAGRAEWLAARHRDPATGLKWANTSDAGTFMGADKFSDLADLAVRYLSPEPPAEDPTEAMERGHRLEPVMLDWYGDQHGVAVYTPDVLYGHGRLLSTIDGEMAGVADLHVEAKSTSDYWQDPPESVFWQCVGQTICRGSEAVDVVWIDASMRFKVHRFVPTDADRDALMRRVDDVLAYIDMGMVPEGAHLTAKHLSSMHPVAHSGYSVELSPVELSAVAEWEQARQARLTAEKVEEAAKAQVLALLGDAEDGRWQDQPVVSWRNNKPSERVDWKALEADHPDLVDGYRKVLPGARVLRPLKALARYAGDLDPVDDDETAEVQS